MSEINGFSNGTMPIHETPESPPDVTSLRQAWKYLETEREAAGGGPRWFEINTEMERLEDQIDILETPQKPHAVQVRQLKRLKSYLLDQDEFINDKTHHQVTQAEIDRVNKLIEQLSAPVAEPPPAPDDLDDDEDEDPDRELTPDEVELVHALRSKDYKAAARLSFKKAVEKPIQLTADEYQHLYNYRLRRDEYQEEHPGEFPDLVMANRYDFDEIGPEYQMSLFIMSELAFANMLPSNMVEGGPGGTGERFFDFFNAVAEAVSDGLDKVDIPALIKTHNREG